MYEGGGHGVAHEQHRFDNKLVAMEGKVAKTGVFLANKAFFKWSKNLAQRFRVRKAGGFCPDESPFGVRCPASDEKSDEIWT
ncbi:MAG TPA: hypothetical protein PKD78_17025, partial [Saprospiraceae bacterium]|nr:hypothetical protein [Saprospiraceae bacterium]